MKTVFLVSLFLLLFVYQTICQNISIKDSLQMIIATVDSPKCSSDEPDGFILIDKIPELIQRIEPIYPDSALKLEIEGTVYVKIRIDTTGRLCYVMILKSDNDIFNQSCIEAAWRCKFTPAYAGKIPIISNVTMPFKFKLDKKKE